MADITVRVAISHEQAESGLVTSDGVVEFRPALRRIEGDTFVTPQALQVRLVAGEEAPTVVLTKDDGASWAWERLERVPNGEGAWTAFTLSDQADDATVNYCDLTLIDKDTLTPLPDAPTVGEAIADLDGRLEPIEEFMDTSDEGTGNIPVVDGNGGLEFQSPETLVAAGSPAGALLGSWQWVPNSTTPSWGQIAGNAAQPVDATILTVHVTAQTGQSFAGILNMLTTGDRIYGANPADPDGFIRYSITGAPTVTATTVAFPVEVIDNGGGAITGWTSVNVVFLAGAGQVDLDAQTSALVADENSDTRASLDSRYATANETQINLARMAGYIGDGVADDAPALQAAFDLARLETGPVSIVIPAGKTTRLASESFLYSPNAGSRVEIVGGGSLADVLIANALGPNYAIRVNESSPGVRVVSLPKRPSVVVRNLSVRGESKTVNLGWMWLNDASALHYACDFSILHRAVSGTGYCDNTVFDACHWWGPNGVMYEQDFATNRMRGDGIVFRGCQNPSAIIDDSNAITIQDCVGRARFDLTQSNVRVVGGFFDGSLPNGPEFNSKFPVLTVNEVNLSVEDASYWPYRSVSITDTKPFIEVNDSAGAASHIRMTGYRSLLRYPGGPVVRAADVNVTATTDRFTLDMRDSDTLVQYRQAFSAVTFDEPLDARLAIMVTSAVGTLSTAIDAAPEMMGNCVLENRDGNWRTLPHAPHLARLMNVTPAMTVTESTDYSGGYTPALQRWFWAQFVDRYGKTICNASPVTAAPTGTNRSMLIALTVPHGCVSVRLMRGSSAVGAGQAVRIPVSASGTVTLIDQFDRVMGIPWASYSAGAEISLTNPVRAAASSLPVGTSMLDTLTGKPLWTDGSNWIDATGATV